MILSEQGRRAPLEKWAGGFLVIGLLILLALLWDQRPDRSHSYNSGTFFCGMERVEEVFFLQDTTRFGGGNTQSNTYAHSGEFSSFLPAKGSDQYGVSLDLTTFSPDQQIQVSIWRYEPESRQTGQLVIAGGEGFYWSTSQSAEIKANGWQKLVLTAVVPNEKVPDKISIYTFSNGQFPVYFDDLEIRLLPKEEQWTTQLGFKAINLEIKDKNWDKIQQKRSEAFRKGILESEDDDWVKAQLIDSVQQIPVQLRLKGDWLDHLQGDKWSYRLKVRKESAWEGMRTFSLHTPAARFFLHEWVAHQLLRQQDVLVTRYDFLNLSVNGEGKGIYAIEEQFDKVLVEQQNRREGPIIRFSEDGFWKAIQKQLAHLGGQNPDIPIGGDDLSSSPVEPFQSGKTSTASNLKQLTEEAQQLLIGYLHGEYSPDQVFDFDRMASYFAVCDLFHVEHGLSWHNMRFYFNPLTRKLEPIAFDLFEERDPLTLRLKPEETWKISGMQAFKEGPARPGDWTWRLWQNHDFSRRYFTTLTQISSRGWLQKQLSHLQQEISQRQKLLTTEFPSYQWNNQRLLDRGTTIQLMLDSYSTSGLQVYQGSPSKLFLINQHHFPVEILGHSLSNNGSIYPFEKTVLVHGKDFSTESFQISSLSENIRAFRNMKAQSVEMFNAPATAKYLVTQAFGSSNQVYIPIKPWKLPFNATAAVSPLISDPPPPAPYYEIMDRTILFKPGAHQISQPLLIPSGMTVEIPPNTQIDLIQGAYLRSHSAIQSNGTQEAPVIFTSSDRTGQGLFLSQCIQKSHFHYTQFKQLQNLTDQGWLLTGAVSGYEIEAAFKGCLFANNRSEDALNLIRSSFDLERCVFTQTAFDAFDADFCTGNIRSCQFQELGNDAIDVSGSVITITDTTVDQPGDKGISAGEASQVYIHRVSVSNAPIAVASKDRSKVVIEKITMINCTQGLTAYQKKPEFGPARIEVKVYEEKGVKRLHAIGPGSELVLGEGGR